MEKTWFVWSDEVDAWPAYQDGDRVAVTAGVLLLILADVARNVYCGSPFLEEWEAVEFVRSLACAKPLDDGYYDITTFVTPDMFDPELVAEVNKYDPNGQEED